jgi:RNA polymerase sigma-70 factor (ECF subfamily)
LEKEITDSELIEKFNKEQTKHAAFELILNKFQKQTYWHIRRIVINHDDADDILQNTFIKVWENLAKFRGDSKLYTWIYRIATNESLLFIQKKKQNFNISIDDENSEFLSHNLTADNYFDGNQIELKLQQAILTLPNKQRLVFNMKYYENMKYEEMSEVLDTSVGALKASYFHAVKKIEDHLKKEVNFK